MISVKVAEISRSKEIPVAPPSDWRWTATHRFVRELGRAPRGLHAPIVWRQSTFKWPRNRSAKFCWKPVGNCWKFTHDSKKTKSDSIDQTPSQLLRQLQQFYGELTNFERRATGTNQTLPPLDKTFFVTHQRTNRYNITCLVIIQHCNCLQ